jgi:predicted ribosomally synthesized peptide with SipW-like signal peptide
VRPGRAGLLLALAAVAAAGTSVGATHAAFTQSTESPGNVITTVPDWLAPVASRSVAQKSEGGETGYLRQNGSFRAYAQVTDAGNPASGTATARAEVPSTGFGVDMAPGSFTIAGLTYNWATAATAVPAGTPEGSYGYDVLTADNAGNSGTSGPYTVVIDNTAPTLTDVQTTNSGVAGRPTRNDVVTLTFSEPIDYVSLIASWTGGSTTATVRIRNDVAGRDRLSVDGSNLGDVDLGRSDYVGAETTFPGSTLTRTGNAITIQLGNPSPGGGPTTAAGTGTMIATPNVAAFDRAGNRVQAAAATESGAADRDF